MRIFALVLVVLILVAMMINSDRLPWKIVNTSDWQRLTAMEAAAKSTPVPAPVPAPATASTTKEWLFNGQVSPLNEKAQRTNR